jgi:hypothetical protein
LLFYFGNYLLLSCVQGCHMLQKFNLIFIFYFLQWMQVVITQLTLATNVVHANATRVVQSFASFIAFYTSFIRLKLISWWHFKILIWRKSFSWLNAASIWKLTATILLLLQNWLDFRFNSFIWFFYCLAFYMSRIVQFLIKADLLKWSFYSHLGISCFFCLI